MTEQLLDSLIYNGYEHIIFGISGKNLPKPDDFRIHAIPISTGCMRGYYLGYFCDKDRLFLDQLTVRTEESVYPALPGAKSFRGVADLWSCMSYRDLKLPMQFTGGFIMGSKLRRGTGINNLSSWFTCKVLLEIKFRDGIIDAVTDWSDHIDQLLEAKTPHKEIENIFDLSYDFLYPHTLAHNIGH